MTVDAQHPEYASNLDRWHRARDATSGQDAVRSKRERYLPKLAAQTHLEYEAYLTRALYYNATGRTVDGMSGLIFRRPPMIEIPAAADYLETDIDTSETPLLAFAENLIEELLQVGRIGLLSDYPPLQGIRTLAEEQTAGGRPYIKTYTAENIINWKVERIGNRSTLTLVVLKETAEKQKDEYESEIVDRWRVLRLTNDIGQGEPRVEPTGPLRYVQELWEKGANGGFVPVDGYPVTPLMAGRPMNFIPFLVCGPMGVDMGVKKPPILDLADVNLSHFRSTADYEHGLHFTGLPTPYVTGHTFQPGETFELGASAVKAFTSDQAKVGFLEFTGAGLGNLSKRLEEKEQMMAALGARLLAAQKRTAETAETAAIHRSGENSVLASLAHAAGAAITKSLNWCLQWAGIAETAAVELNTDYLMTGMTAQDITSLVGAWQAGAVSHITLLDNLQRGEIARQGVTPEEEIAQIRSDGPPLGTMGMATGVPGAASAAVPGAPAASAAQPGATPSVVQPTGPDLAPLIAAIGEMVQALRAPPAQAQPQVDTQPQQPSHVINVNVPAQQPPVVNVTNEGDTINVSPPAVTTGDTTVNVPPAQVTVEGATVNVSVPEQAAPIVNVAAPAAPVVTMPAPVVNVAPAAVTVTVQRGGDVQFQTDANGDITGATLT